MVCYAQNSTAANLTSSHFNAGSWILPEMDPAGDGTVGASAVFSAVRAVPIHSLGVDEGSGEVVFTPGGHDMDAVLRAGLEEVQEGDGEAGGLATGPVGAAAAAAASLVADIARGSASAAVVGTPVAAEDMASVPATAAMAAASRSSAAEAGGITVTAPTGSSGQDVDAAEEAEPASGA